MCQPSKVLKVLLISSPLARPQEGDKLREIQDIAKNYFWQKITGQTSATLWQKETKRRETGKRRKRRLRRKTRKRKNRRNRRNWGNGRNGRIRRIKKTEEKKKKKQMMSPRCVKDVVEIIIERIDGMSENLKKLLPCRPVVAHRHDINSISELTKC